MKESSLVINAEASESHTPFVIPSSARSPFVDEETFRLMYTVTLESHTPFVIPSSARSPFVDEETFRLMYTVTLESHTPIVIPSNARNPFTYEETLRVMKDKKPNHNPFFSFRAPDRAGSARNPY